MTGWST
jgi:SAM-dependent methyltransferase